MSKTDAEYMRSYRARRKAEHANYDEAKPLIGELKTAMGVLQRENEALQAEVKHLKAELAKRVTTKEWPGAAEYEAVHYRPGARKASFNTRPFTPAPKGK